LLKGEHARKTVRKKAAENQPQNLLILARFAVAKSQERSALRNVGRVARIQV